MISLKNITLRNFLSIGQVTQAVNFDRKELTLILGANLDLGGDGARNGTGKCVGINTIVRVRNTITGEIYSMTVGELYEAAKIDTDSNNR